MTKLVTVIGATGIQGGSVVDYLLKSPETYAIRAITRNPGSNAAQVLAARGVELFQADLDDTASLTVAFEGSYAVFAITDFSAPFVKAGANAAAATVAAAAETQQGKNIVNAVEKAGDTIQHFFWSTLADASRLSGGKIFVPHYHSKILVEDYIRAKPALLTKTTFLRVAYYSTNFASPFLKPVFVPTADQYIQMQAVPADTPVACIGDPRANLGAFVEASLAQPEKTRGGKVVFAYLEIQTLGDLLQTWAKANNTTALYLHVPRDAYFSLFPYGAEEMDHGPPKILLGTTFQSEWTAELNELFPGLEIVTVEDTAWNTPSFQKKFPDKDWKDVTILVTGSALPAADIAPKLEYVQLQSAGANHVLGHPLIRDTNIALCTASGVHGGIVGYGAVGRQIARVCKALGMDVYACTLHPRLTPESRRDDSYTPTGLGDPEGIFPSKWFSAGDTTGLHEFLASGLDLLVITVPLTEKTRGLISRTELALLVKRKAFVSNVGRGEIINTEDLIDALEEGILRGAALDVTDPEPLPDGHRLWSTKNLFISPHVSGDSSTYAQRVYEVLKYNLVRLSEGKELTNKVNRSEGY
ncbi:hypothetical protein ACHAQJ_004771 [Trichoderma viride]